MSDCFTCDKLVVRDNQEQNTFQGNVSMAANYSMFQQTIGTRNVYYCSPSGSCKTATLSEDTIKTLLSRDYTVKDVIKGTEIIEIPQLNGTTILAYAPTSTGSTSSISNGTVTLKNSSGSTITLTDPSEDLLNFYKIQGYYVSGISQTNTTPTYQPVTNSGNVCEYWDAQCHIENGLEWIAGGVDQAGQDLDNVIKGTQAAIDEQIAALTTQFNLTIQQAQEAAAAALAAANKAASDGIAAAIKAATDAATAAAAAAAAGIDAGTKDLQKKLLIGGGVAVAAVALIVVATRK